MPLTLVATPIGNPKDITLRAIEVLKNAEYVIGEEKKETTSFLKSLNLLPKKLEWLNEHSDADNLELLTKLCATSKVALITDCGTPGFCDPGAQLVAACRKKNITVTSSPGVASLTVFLSLIGIRLDQFLFRGFLPANSEDRKTELAALEVLRIPTILMDTPYRLTRLLTDIKLLFSNHRVIIGLNLTQPDEMIFDGRIEEACERFAETKAEFILLLLQSGKSKNDPAKVVSTNTKQKLSSKTGDSSHSEKSASRRYDGKSKTRRSKLLKPFDSKKYKGK